MAIGAQQSKSKKHQVGLAVCAVEIKTASAEIQLFPAGEFRARDGRPKEVDAWKMDERIATRLIDQAAARQTPYHLDYEHQTLHAERNGQPAPKSATFSKLEWREGEGLFAIDVAWTKRAKDYIDNEEYGFISPVFPYDKKTGEVLGFFHAALTNDPALDGMQDVAQLAAARFQFSPTDEDEPMNEALLKLLGLKKDASEEEVQQAVAALKADTELVGDLRKALGIEDDADPVAAIAALKSSTEGDPDPAKFVPVGVVKDMQTQLAALTTQLNTKEVDELVDVALSEGKLLPAQEKWARDLGGSDVAALKSYLENAQPIAALKGNQTGGKGPGNEDGEPGADELAICKTLGIDPEDYKKDNAA